MTSRRAPRRRPHDQLLIPTLITCLITVTLAATACDVAADTTTTPQDYLAELEAICEATTVELDALPDPPEQISVTEFAVDAASLLASEAEQARLLDVPDDLADQHRAFVRNTDDQAATWRAIADSASAAADDSGADAEATSDLVELTTRVGELTLGRDDLVAEMGADGCRRAT